jgi:hypothetical protein
LVWEDRRRGILTQITAKDSERERILTLYRKGRITTDEAEGQLDAIARETGSLRKILEAMHTQEALVSVQEAYLTDVATALSRLRGRLETIEQTNDLAAKREIIDLLVSRIAVHTEGDGRTRQPQIRITYAFRPARDLSVDSYTPARPS